MIKKILIADDHSAIRIGVRQICVSEFPSVEIGEATNYAEVFQKLSKDNWDILILDIDLKQKRPHNCRHLNSNFFTTH